ncbi:MAG: hypothetical protein LBP32_00315 [Spirochaetaceae bacterium]|jgi:hypothetical protein|nr:hypothetical protein [Spirochaetaceae bacterium]
MIGLVEKTPPAMRTDRLRSGELETIRHKINNKDYIYEAIQRIALVLSNELLDISQGGIYREQRKRRK